MSKEVEHIGTKTLGLVVGIALAFIYALLSFFRNPTLEIDTLYNIALVTVFFVVVLPLIIFIGQVLWKYWHALSEKVG